MASQSKKQTQISVRLQSYQMSELNDKIIIGKAFDILPDGMSLNEFLEMGINFYSFSEDRKKKIVKSLFTERETKPIQSSGEDGDTAMAFRLSRNELDFIEGIRKETKTKNRSEVVRRIISSIIRADYYSIFLDAIIFDLLIVSYISYENMEKAISSLTNYSISGLAYNRLESKMLSSALGSLRQRATVEGLLRERLDIGIKLPSDGNTEFLGDLDLDSLLDVIQGIDPKDYEGYSLRNVFQYLSRIFGYLSEVPLKIYYVSLLTSMARGGEIKHELEWLFYLYLGPEKRSFQDSVHYKELLSFYTEEIYPLLQRKIDLFKEKLNLQTT